MFEIILEALEHTFFRNALLGGLLASIISSLLSLFIIERDLSFAGVGIAHCTFGGLALGVVSGVDPVLSGAGFGLAVALGIGGVTETSKITADAAIGIAFAASMAFGVILISASSAVYYGELFSYLFGNILTISTRDLYSLALLTAAIGGFIGYYFKDLLFFCVNKEMATAHGVPTKLLHYGLLCSIALTVVMTVRLVGIVLAAGLLVIPAATGKQISSHYRGILLTAVLSSTVSMIGGISLSYAAGLPSGATVVMCASVIFFLAVLLAKVRVGSERYGGTKTRND